VQHQIKLTQLQSSVPAQKLMLQSKQKPQLLLAALALVPVEPMQVAVQVTHSSNNQMVELEELEELEEMLELEELEELVELVHPQVTKILHTSHQLDSNAQRTVSSASSKRSLNSSSSLFPSL